MEKKLLRLQKVFLIIGIIFIALGFFKKDIYRSDEYFYQDPINAYVGGDAYNYIINSNYFIGYSVLGSCFFILSGMTYYTYLLLPSNVEIDNTYDCKKYFDSDEAYKKYEEAEQLVNDNK